jgi:hypothetical protein
MLEGVSVAFSVMSFSSEMPFLLDIADSTLSLANLAAGVLVYEFAPTVELYSLSPAVVFSKGGLEIIVYGNNLRVTGDSFCAWDNNSVQTPALPGPDEATSVVCMTPTISAGLHEVTFAANGYVETTSVLSINVVVEPVFSASFPLRQMVNSSSVLSIQATSLATDVPNPLCGFFQGNKRLGTTDAVISSSQQVKCPIPTYLTTDRDVQVITVTGQTPVTEVQAVEVGGLPDQPEIQQISLKAWGQQQEVWELKAVPVIPASMRAQYRLETKVVNRPAQQTVKFRSSPYIREVQLLTITSQMEYIDESYRIYQDFGVITLNLAAYNQSVYWNSTSEEFAEFVSSFPTVTYASVSKSVKETIFLQNNTVQTHIVYSITYGYADGNVPQLTVASHSIPRVLAGQFIAYSSTVTDGYPCTVQEIMVVGTLDGSFSVSYGQYETSQIPVTSTAQQLKYQLMHAIPNLESLFVTKTSMAATTSIWKIYFTGYYGPMQHLAVASSQLTQDYNTSASSVGVVRPYVKCSMVVSSVPKPLGGIVTFSGGDQTSGKDSGQISMFATGVTITRHINTTSAVTVIHHSSASIDWVITFSTAYSEVSPLVYVPASSSLTGANPTVSVSVQNVGTGFARQQLQFTCSSGFSSTGSFSVVVEDYVTGVISLKNASAQLTQQLNKLFPSTSVTLTGSSTTSKTFLIAFIDATDSGAVNNFQIQSPPQCQDGTRAVVKITPKAGNLARVSGWIDIVGNGHSIAVPSDASSSQMQSAFNVLGYGDTLVTRTNGSSYEGTYAWMVTFLEMTSSFPALSFSSKELSTTGIASVNWTRIHPATMACCLQHGNFTLAYGPHISSSLNLHTSAMDMTNALASILGLSTSNILVAKGSKPANGASWVVEFLAPVSSNMFSGITVHSSNLVLGGSSSQAGIIISRLVRGATAEVVRVKLYAMSTLSGYFTLSLGSFFTAPISVDVTEPRLEDEISAALQLDQVAVNAVNLDPFYDRQPSVKGDYRAWDITFSSVAGPISALGCNVSWAHAQSDGTVGCAVSIVNASSSSPLSGYFFVEYNGLVSSKLTPKSTASQVEAAIEAIAYTDVSVTRLNQEVDGDVSWIVTFLADTASVSPLALIPTHLNGTGITTDVSVIQKGSFLDGNFTLGFSGYESNVMVCDDSSSDVVHALQNIPGLNNVSVSKESISVGVRFLVTFNSLAGDVDLLTVASSGLTGSFASVRAYEVTKGVGNVSAAFRVAATDSNLADSTVTLYTSFTAADVEHALEAIPGMGDVSVAKVVNTVSVQNGDLLAESVSWLVTFTTFGVPSRAGNVPTLKASYFAPNDGSFNVTTNKIVPGCCDVRLTYNSEHEYSSQSVGITIDSTPVVTDISPKSGFIGGNVLVTITGNGFVNQGVTPMCLFGSRASVATIVSQFSATCATPPSVAGLVVVTLKLSDQAVARSSSVFAFENNLNIISVVPSMGVIDQITNVSIGVVSLGHDVEQLSCVWTIMPHIVLNAKLGPYVVHTLASRFNNSFCFCLTPSIQELFVDETNDMWFLNSNATATVALTKNDESVSNTADFYFYSRPDVQSIYPRMGIVSIRNEIVVEGSNFVKTPAAQCRIGKSVVPADVISSGELRCNTPADPVVYPVHQVQLLSPLINTERQILEIRQKKQPGRSMWLSGTLTLSSEGFTTGPIAVYQLSADTLQSAIATTLLRLGNVSVSNSSEVVTDYVSGYQYVVEYFSITFVSRQDDVDPLWVDYSHVTGWSSGDSIRITTAVDGGSDTSFPDVISWSITQTLVEEYSQKLVISSNAPVLEVQSISLSSTSPVTGYFSVGYQGSFTPKISSLADDVTMQSLLRTLPGIGRISVTRRLGTSYGFIWDVTFLENRAYYPLLSAKDVSLSSAASIGLTVVVTTQGTVPIHGTFSLKLSCTGQSSSPINVTSTSSEMVRVLESSFSIHGVAVTALVSNGYMFAWQISLPAELGVRCKLIIASQAVAGTNVTYRLHDVQKASQTLSGFYLLDLSVHNHHFRVNTSVSWSAIQIQHALQSALANYRGGAAILVDQTLKTPFAIGFTATFPITMGNIGAFNVAAYNITRGSSLAVVNTTVQAGNYVPVSGKFALIVDSVASSQLDVNITAQAMTAALQAMSSIDQVVVSKSAEIFDWFGKIYYSTAWNITFVKVQRADYEGVVTLVVNTTSVKGSYVLLHQELEVGHGNFLPVEVSFDGQHFTSNRIALEMLEPIDLVSVFPIRGPIMGGSLINITTEKILRIVARYKTYDMFCRFDGTLVPARVANSTTIQCTTPPYTLSSEGGRCTLDVTINGQDASNDLFFDYEPVMELLFMTPKFGTVLGGTVVNISAPTIVASTTAYCSFDDMVVPADLCIDGLMLCRTPSVAVPRDVHVTFTLNGQDYFNNTLLTFTYNPAPIVSRIDPVRGPLITDSNIKISGQYFVGNSTYAQCRFGDVVVPANLNNEESISCRAPALQSSYEVQTLDVTLLPASPPVIKVEVASAPLVGDQFTVSVSSKPMREQIQLVEFVMNHDIDEVQKITVGSNKTTAHTMVLSVADTGRLPEIQSISTTATEHVDIQALYFSVPSLSAKTDYQPQYQEIQMVTISDTSANVSLLVNHHLVHFSGSSGSAAVAAILDAKLGQNFTVTATTSASAKSWTIMFPYLYGNIALITANATRGTCNVQLVSDGGSCDVQSVRFIQRAHGQISLGLGNVNSVHINQNSSASVIKNALEAMPTVGFVTVSVGGNSSHPIWAITFLQRMGFVPLLETSSKNGSQAVVTKIVNGTTSHLGGYFSLSLGSGYSQYVPVSASASTIAAVIQTLVSPFTVTNGTVSVQKFQRLNNGMMLLVTFPSLGQPIPLLAVNTTELTGTKFEAHAELIQRGETVGGMFILQLERIQTDGSVTIVTSAEIPYDSSETQLAAAVEQMDPTLAPIVVTRTNNSLPGTFTWMLTFPLSAGKLQLMDVNPAGLKGHRVTALAAAVQDGILATVQRISASASSPLQGYFSIFFNGYRTVDIPFDASAKEMEMALEALPNIGDLEVTRIYTGHSDASTWSAAQASQLNLQAVDSLFTAEENTYDWLVTFVSLTDEVPLLTACCDELSTDEEMQMTLRSKWSRDSKISVSYDVVGTAVGAHGMLSFVVGESVSDTFSMSASAGVVKAALESVIPNRVSVTRIGPDLNSHYSYLIELLSDGSAAPWDPYLLPAVTLDNSLVSPPYAQQFATLGWSDNILRHKVIRIQMVRKNTTATCSVSMFGVSTFSMTFSATASYVHLQSLLQAHSSHVIVVPTDPSVYNNGTWDVMFTDDTHGSISSITCKNAVTTVMQSADSYAFGGDFRIGLTIGDHVNYTSSLAWNSTNSRVQSAINALLGANAVVVSRDHLTTYESAWLVTFSGSKVGGANPLMVLDDEYLSGWNAFGRVTQVTKGSSPAGTVSFEAYNRNISVSITSKELDISDALQKLMVNVSNVTVSISYPSKAGSVNWTISYFIQDSAMLGREISFLKVNNTQCISCSVRFVNLQHGVVPFFGRVQLFFTIVGGGQYYSNMTVPLHVSSTDLYYQLQSLHPAIFRFCTVAVKKGSNSVIWTISLAPNSVLLTSIQSRLDVHSLVNGSSVTSSSFTTVSSSRGVTGAFFLQVINGTGVKVTKGPFSFNSSAAAVEAIIGSVGGVTVSKPLSTASQSFWLLTFSALTDIIATPNVTVVSDTSSPLSGSQLSYSASVYRDAAYLPIVELSLPSAYAGSYVLTWQGKSIGHVDISTTATALQQLLGSQSTIAYASVDKTVTAGKVMFYVLVVRKSVIPNLESLSQVSYSANGGVKSPYLAIQNTNVAHANITVLTSAHPIDFTGIAGRYSLGIHDFACSDTTAGVFCSPTLGDEVSSPVGVSSSTDALVSAVESLRMIQDVSVFANTTVMSYNSAGVFVLLQKSYDITFIAASSNTTGSPTTDLNMFTWTPDVFGEAVEGSSGNVMANTLINVPLLITYEMNMTAGWSTDTFVKQVASSSIQPSVVAVEVSLNGQDWSTQGVTFEYIPVATVTSLLPTHGPQKGLTEVVLRGSGFVRSSQLACRFGTGRESIVSAVHFFNSTTIICISPPAYLTGQVAVSVTNNGVFYDDSSSSQVYYTYDQPVTVTSLFPPLGPTTGNFTVKVFGGPFLNTDELRCKFGSVHVQGTFVESGTMICWAPPHMAGIYPIEVTVNDEDYTMSRQQFFYYKDEQLNRISPVSGPALSAGTEVSVFGTGFVNSTYLTCRFGGTLVLGIFVSSNNIICPSPVLDASRSGGMKYSALSEQFNRYPDPYVIASNHITSGRSALALFPSAHYYPLYLSRLVTVEVSNNNQDFTDSGISYLYQADAIVDSIAPSSGQVAAQTSIIINGNNFVNSSTLRCRIGEYVSVPVFLSIEVVMCFTPVMPLIQPDWGYIQTHFTWTPTLPQERFENTGPPGQPNVVYVEVSNNGQDFTNNRQTFTFDIKCSTGFYCPQLNMIPCPPGTFCPGEFNTNFTLCPAGTYNPNFQQADCFRCPIGFICPEEGMQVPRICPSGYVCEVTGTIVADNPCPEGHFCLEGTATSATSCGHPDLSPDLFPIMSHGERSSTLRKGRIAQGQQLFLGARNSGCWTNQTDDFGLQGSSEPAQFWMERHLLPLALDAPFTASRGRFCLDDQCLHFLDESNYMASDYAFDYSSVTFRLRRPVPCPAGMYCHPGTGVAASSMKNFTTPQPCYESMYCPEGSADPGGSGECPAGFYCPFGTKIACPAGTCCFVEFVIIRTVT